MILGTVKELIKFEYRVGLTPNSVYEYVHHGHKVYVEKAAGLVSGFKDEEYIEAGATILDTAKEVWEKSEMIVKVKAPLEEEYKYFREDLIIFTYFHLAANESLTIELITSKTQAIAYETIMEDDGSLPCLKPMSTVAGRLGAIEGAKALEVPSGGSGILISGVPGVEQAVVTIIGAGNVGVSALEMLVGLGANITILDVDIKKLSYLADMYKNRVQTLFSSKQNLELAIKRADLVISAALLPGAKTPKLIKREYYKDMRPGSVIVDVAIDQGGSTEVSRVTYHDDPTYIVDGIVHYSVANMPGAVPRTSTQALNNATLYYGLLIANLGLEDAIKKSQALKHGVNVYRGEVTFRGVAQAFDLPYKELD